MLIVVEFLYQTFILMKILQNTSLQVAGMSCVKEDILLTLFSTKIISLLSKLNYTKRRRKIPIAMIMN